MSELQVWMSKLESEISRELGQPVALVGGNPGNPSPRGCTDTLEAPGVRLILTAGPDEVAAFLAEARVIEAGQTDAEMVRELWSGILASVASGLGGKSSPTGAQPGAVGEPWILRLGNASLPLSVAMAAQENQTEQKPATAAEPAPARSPAASTSTTGTPGNFDLLLEVELEASVRFGSREMELKELLELGPGDVVELDRQVADPVDLIVGDRIVARGEVVLVNGNFGLRVTELAEPVRRLESIRCLW